MTILFRHLIVFLHISPTISHMPADEAMPIAGCCSSRRRPAPRFFTCASASARLFTRSAYFWDWRARRLLLGRAWPSGRPRVSLAPRLLFAQDAGASRPPASFDFSRRWIIIIIALSARHEMMAPQTPTTSVDSAPMPAVKCTASSDFYRQ